MAQYPIKMLKDENGTPFVPLVAPEAVKDSQGTDLQSVLDTKLEKGNIIAGSNITLSVSENDITINSTAGGATTNIIDNLNQSTGGVGVLDAHQGYVLKGMIPGVQNTLTSTSTTDALSAYQGYLLSNRSVPSGGTVGQVLEKKSNTDNDVEWTSLKIEDVQGLENALTPQDISSSIILSTDSALSSISCKAFLVGHVLKVSISFVLSSAINTIELGQLPDYTILLGESGFGRATASSNWFGTWVTQSGDNILFNVEKMNSETSLPVGVSLYATYNIIIQ